MRARSRRLAPLAAGLWLAATSALAQVRGVEAEGAVPVPPGAASATVLRAQAQEAALREAVILVATQLATPPPLAGASPLAGPAEQARGPGEPAAPPRGDAAALADRVRKAFEATAPLELTERYRVVQDVGVRPRQLVQDPAVAEEYAVRVEAQVDTVRVRRALGAAGLLPRPPKGGEPPATGMPSSFGVLVEGLPSAGALVELERALLERTRASAIVPTAVSAREVLFTITDAQLGADPGAILRGPIGSALWLEPVSGDQPGAPLRLRVTTPPPIAVEGSKPPLSSSARPPGAPPDRD